jgi:hypothetical protein
MGGWVEASRNPHYCCPRNNLFWRTRTPPFFQNGKKKSPVVLCAILGKEFALGLLKGIYAHGLRLARTKNEKD